jgi:F-type H+-transporting ATPase subunit b
LLFFLLSTIILPRMRRLLADRQRFVEDDLAKAKTLQQEAEYLQAALNKTRREALEGSRKHIEGIKAEVATLVQAEQRKTDESLRKTLQEADGRLQEARQKLEASMHDIAGALVPMMQQKLAPQKG